MNSGSSSNDMMKESNYSIALGYYFIDKKNDKTTFEEAMMLAEKEMYKDKGEYYRISGHDRRGRK